MTRAVDLKVVCAEPEQRRFAHVALRVALLMAIQGAGSGGSSGRMPTAEQLNAIEATFDFRYPPAYVQFLNTSTAVLFDALRFARFVSSVEEIRHLHDEDASNRECLPPTLIPFVVDPREAGDDLYCFDLSSSPPDYAVSVFSIHTVVHQWQDFAAWSAWLSTLP